MRSHCFLAPLLTACALASMPVPAALAQGAGAEASRPSLQLELNAMEPSKAGCRLTFVVTNSLGKSLDKAAFEMALFNDAGVVDRLTVLDFKDLPSGKTKVTRFDLPGVDCGKIGRVLVNSATACSGAGVDAKACIRDLKTTSRAKVSFGS
ncbi:MAG: hypothetical protein EPN45_08480 [Rhizobiaceae bacterium]|nr:MAG: hypothetical protein EPN45_08480 [Rhizobiaceae bacterium]